MPYNISTKHTDACNELIAKFHECTSEHRVMRLFGYCENLLKDSENLCRYEAKLKKEANFRRSRAYDKEKIKANKEDIKFRQATYVVKEELSKLGNQEQ